ncbi:MAG TPA: alpha/beta hydrolase [Roseococcus sp.]|jgi:pimeloyl-ACP methyl ester carboxylesterase|nr:alpha/beta hydrolase [Roseococcus sp.]
MSLSPIPLPHGIQSRMVPHVNGLTMHVLEAGHETPGRPLLLLLHGFPELAYSWRHVMRPLAASGFHVVAPDLRGYGRTTGADTRYDGDLAQFRQMNLTRDVVGLVQALGHKRVHALVGHDFGSPVAAHATLVRPDIFPAVALMSAPFSGPPALRDGTPPPAQDIVAELAAIGRKHYHWYYSTPEANGDMTGAPQGLPAFIRGYYHHKSADWAENRPVPLAAWSAAELAKLPTYYVMNLHEDMAQTVAPHTPPQHSPWLTEEDVAFYAGEYARTGFQGGLNWYRIRTSRRFDADMEAFTGRTIDVPSLFIAGASDWGIHQSPGALARMNGTACTDMRAVHLVEGAGHWVQQEQPEATTRLLLDFINTLPG